MNKIAHGYGSLSLNRNFFFLFCVDFYSLARADGLTCITGFAISLASDFPFNTTSSPDALKRDLGNVTPQETF